MKRILGVLLLVGVMAIPTVAWAAGDQIGVYVGGHLGMSALNFSGRNISESDGGLGWSPGSKTDTVFGGGITFGYDFDPQLGIPVRLELDYTARTRGDVNSSKTLIESNPSKEFGLKQKDKISLQTLMLNAWVDIPTGTAFTPYLGGGIGFGFIDYKANFNADDRTDGTESGAWSGSSNETNFAWSLGGGVAYDFTDNWTVDLGYRYIDAGKASASSRVTEGGYSWTTKAKAKVQSHDIMLGVRYTF